MRTLFSTRDVHPRDRFPYWHDVACRTIVDHDSTPDDRPSFHAELQAGTLADMGLVMFENSPMAIWHARCHAAHANTDELLLCRQFAGELRLEQNSREVVLLPGDLTLIDPRLPYTGAFLPNSRMLVLKFPRHLLEARIGQTGDLLTRSIKPSSPANRFTSAFFGALPTHADELDQTTATMVRDQALDLAAVSLGRTVGRASFSRTCVLMKLRSVIEARLTDPALDARAVADAAGVSARYANAVLAEENTSIMRLVAARRLERCRKALEDPAQARRTVSEIAYGWGFSDMTHFSRTFRAAYGLTPRDYRKRVCSLQT
jgi:AraC family transcriptional regulator, positive regulator of tynA and feaB